METEIKPENKNVWPESKEKGLLETYSMGESDVDGAEARKEAQYALGLVQTINDALTKREQPSLVFNGMAYSKGYLYNQQKAINYAPPRDVTEDRQVSAGIVHEKIISFAAIFIKYRFKRRVKCYDKNGAIIKGLGDVYDLAIEFSLRMEQFMKTFGLIYWELFTQGNAFVLEDWDVRTITMPDAFKQDGSKVTRDSMDYTYEFLEGLSYKDGEKFQTRRAVSRVLDGRCVIFGSPEIEEVQDQPLVIIEEEVNRSDAEQLYGSLKRWKSVPKERTDIDTITPDKTTLFNTERLKDPKKTCIVHRVWDKPNNRFNLLINGVMMLTRFTTMSIFWPRMNYPLTNVPCERLKGSIYARSIPAKTKFNADYVDWILKNLALKFEQGIIPAILAKSKYTLSRKIFMAGNVAHGVTKDQYEKADPDNNGVTQPELSFYEIMKDVVQTQTLNPTATGELSPDATATEITVTDQNQRDKLAYLLDGLTGGFMDMALRRAETIECKYTLKQKETVVDGKKINVYQNFHIDMGGVNHSVIFDDTMSDPTQHDYENEKNELFKKAFKDKENGNPSKAYIADPLMIRRGEHLIDIEIFPERVREVALQVQQLMGEIGEVKQLFEGSVNMDAWKKIYLETSGRPAEVFNSQDVMKLDQLAAQQAAAGQGGAPAAPGQPLAKPIRAKRPSILA